MTKGAIILALFISPFLMADRDSVIRGKIQGNEPLEGAWIHAIPASAPSPEIKKAGAYLFPAGFGIWYRPMPVDPDGQFEMLLPHGRYHLRAGAKGYQDKIIHVDLTSSKVVHIKPLELKWLGVGRLRIRALFEDGTPMSGRTANLLIRSEEIEDEEIQFSTNDEGYGWIDLIPNVYRVSLVDAKHYFYAVKLEEGRLTDVVLRNHSGGFISGKILDEERQEVLGAHVEAVAIQEAENISSDSKFTQRWTDCVTGVDGEFAIGPMKPGRYVIVACQPGGFVGFSNPISLKGKEIISDIKLEYYKKYPGIGALIVRAVTLTKSGEVPLAGVEIHAKVVSEYATTGEKHYAIRPTNALGYAGASDLIAGKVYLTATYHQDGEHPILYGEVEAEITHGEQREVTLQMNPVSGLSNR